jgi:hypothetical protein
MSELAEATTTPEVTGFRPKHRYRRVECEWIEKEEGAEALWAEVRSDLPLGMIDKLPNVGDCTFNELWDAVAPHVRAWNALGQDAESGGWKPIPPPAEAGRDAFGLVDPLIGHWLLFVLKTTYRQVITDPKASTESAPTEKPPSDSDSDSPAPAKNFRRNLTDSDASSPGI